jgi:hypothetical protein
MAEFDQKQRDDMLREAILQAGVNPTLASVAVLLPGDFDLDEAELADMLAFTSEPTLAQREAAATIQRLMGIEPDPAIELEGAPEPTPEAAAWNKPIKASDMLRPVSDEHDPVQQPPTLTFEEARDAVTGWANKLAAARGRLMAAQARQQAGRIKVADAIGQFVSGFPKKTREGLQREYLASEAERRERVAAGLEPPLGARQKPAGYMTAMRAGQRGRSVNQGYGNTHLGKARSLIAQQQALGLKPGVGIPKLPSQR